MTNVHTEWVNMVHFCNSWSIWFIPAGRGGGGGGGAPPWTPSPLRSSNARGGGGGNATSLPNTDKGTESGISMCVLLWGTIADTATHRETRFLAPQDPAAKHDDLILWFSVHKSLFCSNCVTPDPRKLHPGSQYRMYLMQSGFYYPNHRNAIPRCKRFNAMVTVGTHFFDYPGTWCSFWDVLVLSAEMRL